MNTLDYLFSPLSKDYCVYFYWLSIWTYAVFLMVLISSIIYGIQHKKNAGYYLHASMIALISFVSYFQNRLFYSMCMR